MWVGSPLEVSQLKLALNVAASVSGVSPPLTIGRTSA
jgi:hypothetical protein